MLEFEGHPISVAIRVRPALSQTRAGKESNTCIQVEDPTTMSITNPEDPTEIRVFGFTHCYWSFDGCAELQDGHLLPDLKHVNGSKYADQRKVFDQFGKEMVQNAWLGFNSSLICMGEGFSGKSWTLFGNGPNKGIISLFGSELFKSIKDKEKTFGSSPLGNITPEVKLTMMEIYENKVRDLLTGNSTKYKIVVKVREHPKRGFYVEGLRSVIVTTPEDIQQRLDEGHVTRAISSISLNLISSKATVIVGLSLVQKYRNAKGDEVTMSALIDFYDLPVSGGVGLGDHNERNIAHFKPTTQKLNGRRMIMTNPKSNSNPIGHEGSSTFKSFDDQFTGLVSALGNNSTISYANSTVTKLLERALSGNCKTFVIGHCNPMESGYETSLSSLILADKLQRLRTHPLINEEMTNKLTRELKLENDSLKKMLINGELEKNEFFAWSDKLDLLKSRDSEEFRRQLTDEIKSQVKDNEREIKILNQSQDEKLKLAKLDKPNDNSQTTKKLEMDKKHKPFIFNLNADSQLSGRILHLIGPGQTDFGSAKGKDATIHTIGPGIREVHGSFFYATGKDNKMSIKPTGLDCLIRVNGKQVFFDVPLFHNDRIVFGGSQIWLFQNPREPWADKGSMSNRITFQFAQDELALKSGFFNTLSENGPMSSKLKSDVLQAFPLIDDANAMCDDLDKGIHFDPIVLQDIYKLLAVSIQDFDNLPDTKSSDPREVAVQVTFSKEEMSFLLSLTEFSEKYNKIKSSYVQSQDEGIVNATIGSTNMNSPSEGDTTFADIIDTEVTIGYGLMSFKPLAYQIQCADDVMILDFLTFKPIGSIKIEVTPCNEYFEDLHDVSSFFTSSTELLSKPLHFKLKMGNADALSSKFKDITCKYKFHTEPTASTGHLDSKPSYGSNPQYKYEEIVSIEHATPKLIESLESDVIVFAFYGKRRPKKMRNQFKSEYNHNYCNSNPSALLTGQVNHPEQLTNSPYLGMIQKQKADIIVSKKAEERITQKLGILHNILELSDSLSQSAIPVGYLKKICNAKDQQMATESVASFKEDFTPLPESIPPPKLSTYQKVSEVCIIV